MIDLSPSTSTKPYLIRALYEWCHDNGLTAYVAAQVDESVQVPREHVKNQEIVLNISPDATSQLTIGNDRLSFKARFGGIAREIMVPIDHILAIYARENGQGMAFPGPIPGVALNGGLATDVSDGLQPNQLAAPAPDASARAKRARMELVSKNVTDTSEAEVSSAPSPKKSGQKPTLTRIK